MDYSKTLPYIDIFIKMIFQFLICLNIYDEYTLLKIDKQTISIIAARTTYWVVRTSRLGHSARNFFHISFYYFSIAKLRPSPSSSFAGLS